MVNDITDISMAYVKIYQRFSWLPTNRLWMGRSWDIITNNVRINQDKYFDVQLFSDLNSDRPFGGFRNRPSSIFSDIGIIGREVATS
jgi:hypothetical protein